MISTFSLSIISQIFLISKCNSFQVTSSERSKYSQKPLKVAIFAPNDEGDFSWIEENSPVAGYQTMETPKLANKLSDLTRMDSLARIAAAFPPNGHMLEIKHIDSVSVLGVDEYHVDIQAVVCQEDACMTVMVPIPFPSPCQSVEDEECIIDQFRELDYRAAERLNFLKQRAREEKYSLESIFAKEIIYPSWWQPAYGLLDDCNQILSLLNLPDFRREIQTLAKRSVTIYRGGDWEVELAAIVAVNPSGLYLRVQATKYNQGQNFDRVFNTKTELIDIPLPFGATAHTTEELRTAVLRMIEGKSANI